MTLGQAIKGARKNKGWTQERLAAEAGVGQATISALENDELGARLDAYSRTLIKVAEALEASPILIHHCETCPVSTYLFQTNFANLRNKRADLATIAKQLREQLGSAVSTLDELVASSADVEPHNQREKVKLLFEQMLESEQRIRILKFQMMIEELR
jgi:transcriptional regulator with XRE-family HTH domain